MTNRRALSGALRCPNCGSLVDYKRGAPLPPGFPFCGERCKMIDLNKWLDEEYALSRELTPDEQKEVDPDEMSRENLLAMIRELQGRAKKVSRDDEEDELVV